jgi:hypothetical protein
VRPLPRERRITAVISTISGIAYESFGCRHCDAPSTISTHSRVFVARHLVGNEMRRLLSEETAIARIGARTRLLWSVACSERLIEVSTGIGFGLDVNV